MSMIKIVLGENTYAFSQSGRFQKVFPDRKSFTSDITEFPAGDGDHPFTFVTVYLPVQGLHKKPSWCLRLTATMSAETPVMG